MSAPNPKLFAEGTSTPLTPFDFDSPLAGAESAEWEFDLENDGATAEDLTEVSIGVLESQDAGVTWHQDGNLTLERWVQVQAYGVDGTGIEAQTTSWTPVGVGARLVLKPIPADTRRKLRAKVVLPAGISSYPAKIKFIVYWREGYIPLSQGFHGAGFHGVIGGTGDADFTQLLSGGELTQTGTPDGNVQIAQFAAKVAGVPIVKYAQAKALSASGSGNARWITLSVAADGTVTATAQSPEVTAPSAVTNRPAVPAGEALLGWVHRDDGTIVTADIYGDDTTRGPFALAVDTLDIVIGPGQGIVDNRKVWRDKESLFTLADDDTTTFYLLPDSTIEAVVSGDDPSWSRAEPLWQLTAASGAVTVTRDLRRFLGPPVHRFAAHFSGTNTVGQAAYYTQPEDRRGYIKLPKGAQIGVGAIGNRTAGALRIPLERWDGAAWTSLFSSTTKEPQLAFNATDLVVSGFLPDTMVIQPGDRLRWRIAAIPTTGGSTDASDAQVWVDIEDYGP